MAQVIRNTDPNYASLVADFNALKVVLGAGATFHLDKSEVTVHVAASATDLPTAIALLQECMGVYDFHFVDTLAHQAADTHALAGDLRSVKDLTTAEAAANDLKAKFNLHIASTAAHYNADSTNTIATANATDLASLEALVNAIESALNAHMASGPTTASKRLVSA